MASCKEEREPGLFVKQGSKLHSKILSKEAAAQLAAPSFRVYYSVASAGAVPFLWESQPGTPKNDSPSAATLPPLTPPPSYYAGGASRSKNRRGAAAVFPRFTFLRRRPRHQTTPSSSSSWSTSSTMSPVFTVQSSPSPAAGFSADADARCFGMEPECCERGIVKGWCNVVGAVRNVLATVVGAKPGRRA